MVAAMLVTSVAATADEASAELPQVLEATLEADSPVTVGDEVLYTVTVEHDPATSAVIDRPRDGSRWREIDRQVDTDIDGDTAITRATIHYAIFRPGPTSGPPVSVAVETGDDTTGIDLDHHGVEVDAVSDQDAPLADPRGPWVVLSEYTTHLWIGLGIAGLGLFALLGTLALRRRDRRGPPPPAPTPREVAIEALKKLERTDLDDKREWKPFFVQLSAIIRRYLGDRWHFPGTEHTTTEIVDTLTAIDDPDFRIEVNAVADWLRTCDRVKFAAYTPTTDEVRRCLEQAFDIVERTRNRPASEDGDPADDDAHGTTSAEQEAP